MNQSELIECVAQENKLAKTTVKAVLESAADHVYGALNGGEEAVLPGLGKLSREVRSARSGRNPKTGEAIEIPAKRVVKFSAAKALKDAVA